MKCPNCGAEIAPSIRLCEYCGAQITPEMLLEQERLQKDGCPKCGSTNVTFRRENQGEIKGKKANVIVHSTVGLCKDCGYTWRPNEAPAKPKSKIWLWVIGWIFIFPVPLTILMLRNRKLPAAARYAIIAVGWILYLIIGFSASLSGRPKSIDSSGAASAQAVETVEQTPATVPLSPAKEN